MSNFQEIILRLQTYWAQQGCLCWQPYSEKVGAGTMNPATVLQVIGPEPWNVAYVEPSYRPDDGRFGENPNRMQMHTQYQVILKPDPGNPQELYLESLRAIGIDTGMHDIRFVEDNWESPALGAWGLGWEVWLDGLEITQFTYFQQSASQVLDLPAVEITYGLERIAMFLQGVRQVWDIDWDGRHTYGDVLLAPEIDHCRYDFEVADVERLTEMYRLFEEEARKAIAAGLVVPAHDYVLRCSHTFNVLDARGAVGVTERAAYFGRMRDLARQVAENYLAQRERLEFPLLKKLPPRPEVLVPEAAGRPSGPADFVLEVGVEELPPAHLRSSLAQWAECVPVLLEQLRLPYEELRVMATPRRLVVFLKGLAGRQADRELEVKGPPANRAFDEDGKPTKAAQGFARSQGVPVESLEVRTEGDKSYVVAHKKEMGRTAAEVLSGRLAELISGLKFPRAMRWDHTGVAFSRPVRWLLALHGDQVVPFGYADLVSGRTTRGPRPLGSPDQEVAEASSYLSTMESWKVIVDREQRRRAVAERVAAAAATVDAETPDDPDLLDEVTDLVECPVAVLGEFEQVRLNLPTSVLITVMKKHQRYFPVIYQGHLINRFVAVSNGERTAMERVRQGNEDVLRARYADADYFVKQDLMQSLESFVPRLQTLTFQVKLGSMGAKQDRIVRLLEDLLEPLALGASETEHARRAASLCKADLVTSMVIEMTSLQGILGEVYALAQGEPQEVARAIREHYLPRSAGDALPGTRPGLALGLADRMDSLVGLFGVGLKPTGSADPYGLRRTALGLVALLVSGELRLDLARHLKQAALLQPVEVAPAQVDDALAFVADRMSVWLKEQGFNHDVVEAAVAEQGHDPYGAYLAARSLAKAVGGDGWTDLLTAYARCKRIVRELPERHALKPELYTEESAQALHKAWETAAGRFNGGKEAEALLEVLRELQPAIDRFFDEILVMAKEPELRNARLGLVQRIAELPDGVADFSRLEGF